MKKNVLTFLCCLLLGIQAFAQDRTVSGTVKSKDDGLPIPGVSVMLKGTKIGGQTNMDGKYSIKVPENGTNILVFTFMGYVAQEVPANGATVNVTLSPDNKQLSEVVVTALGITRKKNELPFAAQEIKGDEVSRTRDNNFVNGLSGKVAGLDVKQSNTMGGSTNIVIRGMKSLKGNNQALFVIDGIPVSNANTNTSSDRPAKASDTRGQQEGAAGYDYGSAAADINPDDIASVNVLKGAAATALYGSRAANGVIMITTKKGQKGSTNITINSGVTFGKIDKSTFVKYQQEYGAGYRNQYSKKPYSALDGNFLAGDYFGDGSPQRIVPFTEDASYGGRFDPNLMVYTYSSFDPNSPNYGKKSPWIPGANGPATFYKTSVASNQSVSIDGGGENGTFKVGYTRNDETGVLPNSKLTKNLFNFSGSYNITKTLTASANANYSKVNGLGRYGTGYDAKNVNQSFRQWWEINTDMKEQKDGYFRNLTNTSWNLKAPNNPVPYFTDNPYWTRYQNYEDDGRNRYFGNVALNWKVVDWFDVTGRVSYDGSNEYQNERIAVGSAAVPLYSRYDRTYSETNFDLLLNFNKKITEDISFRGLLGSNLRRTNMSSIRARTNGGLVVPLLYSLSNSVSPIEAPQEEYTRVAVDGLFASTTFGYKDFLFLDMTLRRDQSTTLPKDHNSYFYPSIAGSFVFSKLLKEQNWLYEGKLRLNYAEVGNDAPPLSIIDTYDKPTGIGSVPFLSLSGTKNNPNLKPERTRSVEAGLDMSFLDGRVGFDLSVYRSNSVDQIQAVAVTTATGYSFKYVNAGTIRNQGFEISAFGTPIRTRDFSWNINVNFARNRNMVVDLFEGTSNLQLGSFQGGVTLNATKGQPYGTLQGQNFVYAPDGQKVVGSNGYYMRTDRSDEVIGNVNPDWTGGVGNTFKYKGLSLNFLIDIKKGGSVFSLDQYYGQSTGLYPESVGPNDLGNPKRLPISQGGGVILGGVKNIGTAQNPQYVPNDKRVEAYDNDTTPYGYKNNPQGAFVYDASFVKLREVALTYSLPKSWINKIKAFKGIDVSLVGRNLWIIHKNLPYADPEAGLSSGNLQGYQSGAYPSIRTYGFNLKFKL